jgi:BirA family biotin operon repressor/biotin-[acetyl-CoA-carboxylase] ligase
MAVSTKSRVTHPLLLVLLADGQLHSGEWLADELGVSRAAVWKGVERLRALGIAVIATARRGYRLAQPVELLDARRIRAVPDANLRPKVRNFELLFEVDSTNTRLLAKPAPPFGRADLCISELQNAGRGRRGRRWIAPFGSSLALSLAWAFPDTARDLPALSLVVGVAVVRALRRAGAEGIGLKWPNDIWFADRKVGGILIELRAESGGPSHVVIGVGLNVHLSAAARREIEATGVRVAAVADASAAPVSRNFIAGAILAELLSMLAEFEHDGFAAFRPAWSALDALRGRRVRVLLGEQAVAGIARGADVDGALLLEVEGRREKFVSGEVSLRLEDAGT